MTVDIANHLFCMGHVLAAEIDLRLAQHVHDMPPRLVAHRLATFAALVADLFGLGRFQPGRQLFGDILTASLNSRMVDALSLVLICP